MSDLSDGVKNRIQRLVDDSDEISNLFENLISQIELKDNSVIGAGPWWAGPTDELSETQQMAQEKYELWYSSARPLVSEYAPDRISYFDELYTEFKSWLELDDNHARSDKQKAIGLGIQPLTTQTSIVRAIPSKVESEQLQATKQVSKRITGDEVQHARSLYDEGHLRAAGVIAGVALERHLLTMCETAQQELEYGFMDGISSLSQTLNEGGIVSDDDKRLLDHLSGLRNKCAHADESEPTTGEIDRLVSEANGFIRQ